MEPLPLLIGCLYRMLVSGRERVAEYKAKLQAEAEHETDSMLDDSLDVLGGTTAGGPSEMKAAIEALQESLDELAGDLDRLSGALSSTALEEFGLDKVADFCHTADPHARTKLATAALLCGTYETLMQGSLFGVGQCNNSAVSSTTEPSAAARRRLPTAASLRALLRLYDGRQNLLELVRPNLPSQSQQRVKKAAGAIGGGNTYGSNNASAGGSLGGDGGGSSSLMAGGGVASSAGAGLPGFSASGSFGLTLYPEGMPCLGMKFVEDMLSVLNIESEEGSGTVDGEDTEEGDTELDPGLVDQEKGDPPTEVLNFRCVCRFVMCRHDVIELFGGKGCVFGVLGFRSKGMCACGDCGVQGLPGRNAGRDVSQPLHEVSCKGSNHTHGVIAIGTL